jgi:hypothetical protein
MFEPSDFLRAPMSYAIGSGRMGPWSMLECREPVSLFYSV